MAMENQSVAIEGCIQKLHAGDEKAREELLNCACDRLTRLTRKMLKSFGRVKRWEETDDVVQNAMLRLYRSLAKVQPVNAVEFYKLAALNIRRELLDLAKHYYGPQGHGANYASLAQKSDQSQAELPYERAASVDEPDEVEPWTAFHEHVERLPAEEKEAFDLLWYQELSQAEAAELLKVSERTIKRRWASARLMLHEALKGRLPDF